MTIISYVRAIALMLIVPLWMAVYSAWVILQLLLGVKKETVGWGISKIWAQSMLWVSGVKVDIRGTQWMPRDRGFLYVFNHTSHYDIPVMFFSSPKYFNFGAKSELFSIPIFGQAIRKTGALEIERKNRDKVLRIYKESEQRVAQGEAFALAPEGTRRDGFGQLGDFKMGPFYFAVNSKMPIVPVVMVGCEEVVKKHSVFINVGAWTRTVVFEILEPVYPDFSKGEEQMPELKNKVYSVMQKRLSELWSERRSSKNH